MLLEFRCGRGAVRAPRRARVVVVATGAASISATANNVAISVPSTTRKSRKSRKT